MGSEKPAIDILSCEAFAWELDALAGEINQNAALPYKVNCTYLSQRLHLDFALLGEEVAAALGRLRARRVALLYGSLCHPDFFFLPGGVCRLQEINCIHALSGKSTAREPRAFFLTPLQLAKWRENFSFESKTPEEKREFRKRFRKYCDTAVFLDTEVVAADGRELAFFAESAGLAAETRKIGLNPFRKTLRSLLDATWAANPGRG